MKAWTARPAHRAALRRTRPAHPVRHQVPGGRGAADRAAHPVSGLVFSGALPGVGAGYFELWLGRVPLGRAVCGMTFVGGGVPLVSCTEA